MLVYNHPHVNGWNAVYMVGKRRCKEAQGEINNLAKQSGKLIEKVNPALGIYAQPQGVIFGKCPEGKWDECGYCKGIISKISKQQTIV